MKPEQQRIAIAEACGWGVFANTRSTDLLDYCNDLNAMHEAEISLTADQWYKYDSMMPLRDPQKIHATASQRAEAFLRTINKWEETKL